MTGLITGIKRMEIHDGDGLRTTVFFKGCPLRCVWCHNPESISPKPQTAMFSNLCLSCSSCTPVCPAGAIVAGQWDAGRCTACGACARVCPVEAVRRYGEIWEDTALADRLLQDAPFFAHGGGVTLSGGECLMQADFAVSLAKILRQRDVGVDIDTCGCVPWETFRRILPYADTFLFDVKAVDPAVHRKCTGRDNRLILRNLQNLSRQGAKIEIRIPLAVGFNDGERQATAELLSGLSGIRRIKVLRCHSFAASRYRALGLPAPPEMTTTAEDVAEYVRFLKSYDLPAVNGVTED